MNSFFKRIIIGLVIGGGLILPGVSGAVLAVILGVYEKIIDSINNLFNNFFKNIIYLLPISTGILMGVFLFGNVLFFLFAQYPSESKAVFMGIILGSLPLLFKKLKDKNKHLNKTLFIMAIVLSFSLYILNHYSSDFNLLYYITNNLSKYLVFFITGVIYVSGKIIPGISSSFLLIMIGMYDYILEVIASFFKLTLNEYFALMPFFLGVLVGGIILLKLITFLFNQYYNETYSIIIGFIIGSILFLYPGFTFNINSIIKMILIWLSFKITYKISITQIKH